MKLKKELGALCCAVVFAYVWQLGLLLLCYVSNPKGDFIQLILLNFISHFKFKSKFQIRSKTGI